MDQQQYQPYQQQPPQQPVGSEPGRGAAIAALVLGIVAMVLPVPVVDLVAGIIGLILVASARNQGFEGGLLTGALVCSIIGTISAAIFTISCFACTCGACAAAPYMWW